MLMPENLAHAQLRRLLERSRCFQILSQGRWCAPTKVEVEGMWRVYGFGRHGVFQLPLIGFERLAELSIARVAGIAVDDDVATEQLFSRLEMAVVKLRIDEPQLKHMIQPPSCPAGVLGS